MTLKIQGKTMKKNQHRILMACVLLAGALQWSCGGGESSGTHTAVPPAITAPPVGQTVTEYGTATLSVTASGSDPLLYQWKKDGTDLAGATKATLTLSPVAMMDAGWYTVTVNNFTGPAVTSAAAVLTVNAYDGPPIILSQPESVSVTIGKNATFSVTAVGPAPLSYQWRKDGVAITGATASSYAIASVARADAGVYSVKVSNAKGDTLSANATLAIVSPQPGSFTRVGELRNARFGHTATLLKDGTVLVLGGQNATTGTLDSAEIYDPSAKTFTALSTHLILGRYGHTATLLSDGTVLIAGGFAYGGATATTEIFDPADKSFTAGPSLLVPRAQHTASLTANGVVFSGGRNVSGAIYTTELGSSLVTMGANRYSHAATVLDDASVLITGGFGYYGTAIATAEIATPTASTLDLVMQQDMNTPRAEHTASLLADGTVLVAGGLNAFSSTLASAEIFDPATGTFTSLSHAMGTPRCAHTATVLMNGCVLLAGGRNFNGGLANAEFFDLSTQAFTTINMNTARSQHTATLLADGSVLVTGGTSGLETLHSAEIYQ